MKYKFVLNDKRMLFYQILISYFFLFCGLQNIYLIVSYSPSPMRSFDNILVK